MSNHYNVHILFGHDPESICLFNETISKIVADPEKYSALSNEEFWREWRDNEALRRAISSGSGTFVADYLPYSCAIEYGDLAAFLSKQVPNAEVHCFITGDGYMPTYCRHAIFKNGELIQDSDPFDFYGSETSSQRVGIANLEKLRGEEPSCSICEKYDLCDPFGWHFNMPMCDPSYDPATDKGREL